MTFCHAPWTNLEVLPSGDILPCCKFQNRYYPNRFNIQQHSIDQYRQSDFLQSIKQEFEQGHWPKGCERCKIEEDSMIKSKRQLDYVRWQKHYDQYDFHSNDVLTVSLALGNTCNLKCIICNPHASSKWGKEYQDIYHIVVPSIEHLRQDLISSITNIAPNLIHIDFHGGEPLLSGIDKHQELLNHYVTTDQAKNITLHYHTNGILFPDQQWLNLWSNFANVEVQLSIDGLQEKFEYQRYPGKWNDLLHTIDQYLLLQHKGQITLSVAHTVSAFNIYYLEEFYLWCMAVGLPKPWMGKLHDPAHLRPAVWPLPARQHVIKKLGTSRLQEVRSWAKLMQQTDDSELFDKFQKFVYNHDQYRNLDFKLTFPDMAQYL